MGDLFFNFHLVYGQKYDKICTNISVGIADLTEGIMKKLLIVPMFLSACVCSMVFTTGAFATPFCPGTTVSFSGTQHYSDNEFIYNSMATYNRAKQLDSQNGGYLNGGKVFECDGQQGCPDESVFYAPSGYIWKGKDVGGNLLSCSAPVIGEDAWELLGSPAALPECPDTVWSNPATSRKIDFISGSAGGLQCYFNFSGGYAGGMVCCFTGDHLKCLEAQKRGEPANWTQSKTCNCGDKHVWNSKTGHCELKPDNGGGGTTGCANREEKGYCATAAEQGIADWSEKDCKCTCKQGKGTWNGRICAYDVTPDCGNDADWKGNRCVCKDKTKEWDANKKQCVENSVLKCLSQRKTANGKACCWLKDSVAEYYEREDECRCSGGKKFEIGSDGKGKCVAVVPVPPTIVPPVEPDYECPTIDSTWLITYKDCPDVISAITGLQSDCAAKIVKDHATFDSRLSLIRTMITTCESQQQQAAASQRITVLIGNINGKLTGWKDSLNVWKNKEGKFNTARLASDSIAGVVLGTAGGLITSSVVKKAQVKQGFEDISCTIGGQKVADWHDEFKVGIQ